ncbi:MAG: hypothetical protein ACREJI_07535, partial [Candidatus Methylomirabilales bacterium]
LLVRRWFVALPEVRREALASVRPTIDLDPTDTEVYGKQKEGVAWNHAGQRVGRPIRRCGPKRAWSSPGCSARVRMTPDPRRRG